MRVEKYGVCKQDAFELLNRERPGQSINQKIRTDHSKVLGKGERGNGNKRHDSQTRRTLKSTKHGGEGCTEAGQ